MNKNQAILKNKLMPDSPNAEEDIVKSSVQLVHAVGMHARPAVKLTKLAKRFQSQIAMRVAGAADWIDAKSVAKVMAMRAARDSIIEFEARGADAPAAVAALVGLIAQDFPDTGR
jgi:phosphocarrier protein